MLNEHVIDEVPRKVLGMSTSIQDLPMDRDPYGFWVDRSGNFLQVSPYGHDEGLDSIVSAAKNYLDKKGIPAQLSYGYDQLLNIGWCRIVLSEHKIYYQMGLNQTPTTFQMKFMNVLKDMYDKEVIVKDR